MAVSVLSVIRCISPGYQLDGRTEVFNRPHTIIGVGISKFLHKLLNKPESKVAGT